ncbi:helix-turn-helix domain-containing protein [Niveibacterium sp. SC-1]|uniref:AraC family transcriptional regulator n=1 Tax=Niveibacterium sp. SC-1 TaxID=3135646 RepID=UPI00311FBB66
MPIALDIATYSGRVNRVIDHVEALLWGESASVSLESAAERAHFAPTHFHKVFRAVTGHAFADYVRNQRLRQAASVFLARPSSSVLDVAFQCGFGSGEAFARAFRRAYGMAPSDWRAGGHVGYRRALLAEHQRTRRPLIPVGGMGALLPDPDPAKLRVFSPELGFPEHLALQSADASLIRVERRPALRIAYFRVRGAYGDHVSPFWAWCVNRCDALGLDGAGREYVGVWLDDPSMVPVQDCRHDVGIVLREGETAPREVPVREVVEYDYLVYPIDDVADRVDHVWRWLLAVWMPRNGLAHGYAPGYEYLQRAGLHGCRGRLQGELCIPVRPR